VDGQDKELSEECRDYHAENHGFQAVSGMTQYSVYGYEKYIILNKRTCDKKQTGVSVE
jgi:hypothetical protein